MIRLVSIFGGTLLIGVVVGTLIQRPQPAINGRPLTPTESLTTDSIFEDALEGKSATIADLTDRNHQLKARIGDLEDEIAAMPASVALNETIPDFPVELSVEAPVTDAALQSNAEGRRRRRPDDEESRERRDQMLTQVREKMLAQWDKVWEKSSAESKERITDIANYQQELMDIRREMRQAETDEEREAIMQSMTDTQVALKTTLRIEQQAQLSGLAERHGIGEEDMALFIKDTQITMKSPVFQSGFSRGGFGGPQRGGGSGGGKIPTGTPSQKQ